MSTDDQGLRLRPEGLLGSDYGDLARPGDYHVHTTFSDGSGSVAECVECAVAASLTEIGIADHFSAVQPTPWDSSSIPLADLDRYVAEVRDAARRHERITVLLGVEADYVPEHEAQMRRALVSLPLDYAIGGVHVVDGFEFDDPALRADPRWSDLDALFATYYGKVRDAAASGLFDVIAHLDYIGLWGHQPGAATWPAIEAALDAVAASGVALELNTDRISDPAGVMYPSDDVLRRACRRGIPLVISSDAHEAAHVGRLWDEAVAKVFRAGYRESLRLSDRSLVPLPESVR
jgi:histidinol-phosphatase (PHP family)